MCDECIHISKYTAVQESAICGGLPLTEEKSSVGYKRVKCLITYPLSVLPSV